MLLVSDGPGIMGMCLMCQGKLFEIRQVHDEVCSPEDLALLPDSGEAPGGLEVE